MSSLMRSLPPIIRAVRCAAVTFACVFAADEAVGGSSRAVVGVAIAVAVAVWWTLRDETVIFTEDVALAVVLVIAGIIATPFLAFIPAALSAVIGVVLRDQLHDEPEEPQVVASERVAVALAQPTQDDTEAESRRLAARLHDRVGEWLTFVQIELDRQLSRRPNRDLSALRDDVTESLREVEERSRQLRARVTLAAPLADHVARLMEWFSDHHGSDVTVHIVDPDSRLTSEVEQPLLTVLHEAVDNIGRHADAETVSVTWDVKGSRGTLTIHDDGAGFNAGSTTGPGIAAMRRAARAQGTTLSIDSAPGDGTTVTATVAPR